MGEPQAFRFGLVKGWRLRYIVRTGGLWKGNIGRADIDITLKPKSARNSLLNTWSWRLKDVSGPVFRYSYPKHAQWDGKSRIEWHFADWNPKRDVVIENLAWVGLNNRYHFWLPYPYKGDSELYTDEQLEELVTDELRSWEHIFPEEVNSVNREDLKGVIAECLSREIVARHGEAFSLGQIKEGEPPPPEATSLPSGAGHCYGKWHSYFMSYHYHGGWYRPDPNKSPIEIAQGLNRIEEQNRFFLRKYFGGEEKLPRYEDGAKND
jgi:hypothetical protein